MNSFVKARLDKAQAFCTQLARENKLLRNGLEDVFNFIVRVVDGRIPIAGLPQPQHASPVTPTGMVSRAVFDTHVVEQKRELALLNQQILGGGYTIMGQTFVLPEDSVVFAAQHFPPAAYECITGIMSMLQNLKDEVVRKVDRAQEDLHAHKIGRTPRQTAMVVSFATKYFEQFEGSKDTVKDRGVDFNASRILKSGTQGMAATASAT